MIQLVIICLLYIAIGLFIYVTKYKDKGGPKVGIKRENLKDYYKDYTDFKLYWTSICFVLLGVLFLLAILILEIVFS